MQLLVEISVGKANIHQCDRLNRILGLILWYDNLDKFKRTKLEFSQKGY